jgi:hypothetical protein
MGLPESHGAHPHAGVGARYGAGVGIGGPRMRNTEQDADGPRLQAGSGAEACSPYVRAGCVGRARHPGNTGVGNDDARDTGCSAGVRPDVRALASPTWDWNFLTSHQQK